MLWSFFDRNDVSNVCLNLLISSSFPFVTMNDKDYESMKFCSLTTARDVRVKRKSPLGLWGQIIPKGPINQLKKKKN